jgi:hypothetical protein
MTIYKGTPEEYIAQQNKVLCDLGVNWIRSAGEGDLTSLNWSVLEPAPGVFGFDLHDARVRDIQSRNLIELGNVDFSVVPRFAQLEGHCFDERRYLEYLQAIVERYDGDGLDDMPGLAKPIKHWEIGNEVILPQMFAGTMEEYAHVLQISYQSIKANCPDCLVLIGGWVTGKRSPQMWQQALAEFEAVLASGGGNDFDIMNYHEYTDDCDFLTSNHISGFKELLAEYGFSKPFWITEANTKLRERDGQAKSTIKKQAEDLVKRIVVAFAAGVDVFFWQRINDGNEGGGLIDQQGVPKPDYYNLKMLIENIEDFSSVERIDAGDENIYVYKFIVNGKPLVICWSEEGSSCINLAPYLENGTVKITHTFTEYNRTEPDIEMASPQNIFLNETPIFISNGDLLRRDNPRFRVPDKSPRR